MKRKMNMHEILTQYWPRVPDDQVDTIADRAWKRIETELDKRDTSLRSLYGDGWNAPHLKQREFQVLTAISLLGEGSDIHRITDIVEDWVGGTMIGQVYAALHDLEKRGLIKFHRLRPAGNSGEPGHLLDGCALSGLGSHPTHRYEVTEQGDRALRRAKLEGKELTNPAGDGWLKDLLKGALRIR